jgi:hypothetical protein
MIEFVVATCPSQQPYSHWSSLPTQMSERHSPCILIFRPPSHHHTEQLLLVLSVSVSQDASIDICSSVPDIRSHSPCMKMRQQQKNKPLTTPQTCAANLRHTCTRRVPAFMASYVLCSARHRRHNNAVKVGKSELVEPSLERSKRALI